MTQVINPAPLVSVIVPCYNAAPFLETCLDNLTSQTLKHIEIIPVNDGSSDRSGIIMNIFSAKDERVRPIQRKQPGGFALTVNNGIAQAKGHYVAIISPCYTPHDNMLEMLYEAAASAGTEGADVTHAPLDCTLPNTDKTILYPHEQTEAGVFSPANRPEILLGAPMLCPALFKRDFLYAHDLTLPAAADDNLRDIPFFLATLIHAKTACCLDTPLAGYNPDAVVPYTSPEDGLNIIEVFDYVDNLTSMLRSRLSGIRYALDAIKSAHFRAAYHALPTDDRADFLKSIRRSLHHMHYKTFSDNPHMSRADKDFIFQAAFAPPIRFTLGYGLRTKLKERALPQHAHA